MKEYSELIDFSLRMAIDTHEYYVDKSHNSYILHPLQVASMFMPNEFRRKCLAFLHDTLEDCKTYEYSNLMEKLQKEFDERFIEDLLLLTRRDKSVSYEQYIDSIIKSKRIDVMFVKLYDLYSNSDNNRISHEFVNEHSEDWVSRRKKYKDTIRKLECAIRDMDYKIYTYSNTKQYV